MLEHAFSWMINMDQYLFGLFQEVGSWSYLILALIVFGESGIVLLPFLPGDSLLFTAGSVASMPSSPINVVVLMLLLVISAFLGNMLNYYCGLYFARKHLLKMNSKWINPGHLHQAQLFYEKYGPIAILLGRFVPFVRTFAPFVAGTVSMPLSIFTLYSFMGAVVWIGIMVPAGYWFGQIPWVQERLHWMIVAIFLICLFPAFSKLYKKFRLSYCRNTST